jgi:hypothetical protein
MAYPTTRVAVTAFGVAEPGLLGCPRYKMWRSTDGQYLYLCVQPYSAAGDSCYYSDDHGETWTDIDSASTLNLEYHASLDYDGTNLHIGDMAVDSTYWQRAGGNWTLPPDVFDDYSGAEADTQVVVDTNGRLWLVSRPSYTGGADVIHYRYSDDHGDNWSAPAHALTVYEDRRIGLVLIGGLPAVVMWRQGPGGTPQFEIWLWNGSAFAELGTHIHTTANNLETRNFSCAQDADGLIHLIWRDYVSGAYCLVHATKTVGGAWSAAATFEPDATATNPLIAVRGSEIFVVYMMTASGTVRPFYRKYSVAAGWSADAVQCHASTTGLGSINTVRTFSGDYLPVAWTDSAYHIYFICMLDAAPPSGISVTPSPGTGKGASVAPTTVLGSLSITPGVTTAKGVGVAPTTVFGSLLLTPTGSLAKGASINPTTILGALSLSLDAAIAAALSVDPTLLLGSIAIAPGAGTLAASSTNPSIVLGAISITPSAGYSIARSVDPTVDAGGNVSVTPAASSAECSSIAATVILGSLAFAPSASSSAAAILGPDVLLGALSLVPGAAGARTNGIDPAVILGSIAILLASASSSRAMSIDPTVIGAGITYSPDPAVSHCSTAAPTLLLSGLLGILLGLRTRSLDDVFSTRSMDDNYQTHSLDDEYKTRSIQ